MPSFTVKLLKNLYRLNQIYIQTKMNAYKDFHAFNCISVMKTYVTNLVLKNKNAISHSCS